MNIYIKSMCEVIVKIKYFVKRFFTVRENQEIFLKEL